MEMALKEPAWGQVRVAKELKKQGLMISPAGVHCVWLRHDLENIKKRLKALEAKSLQDGVILTEVRLLISTGYTEAIPFVRSATC